MLPQIFRVDSPVFQLKLPPEHQQSLERTVADLPGDVFTASDSLGWVYQFWQAKKKDEVNASENKIGERELPAVTQLFTEPYMVSFLLDNSLGAWWAARRLSDSDLRNASSEEELRSRASIPGIPLDYLRFTRILSPRQGEGEIWNPAAGSFDSWPEQLADLKTLDPCCGSGHFLVAAFLMLVPMRMELDNLSAKESVDAVLRENIHGLELDPRCVEVAVFALALAAWKYPEAGGYRTLPELNIACSGLAINAKKNDWLALAQGDASLEVALEELYEQFQDAPVLGSLINPEAGLKKGSLLELNWENVAPLLMAALDDEHDMETSEISVVASGVAKAAALLADRYQLIITNVPYLARGRQDERLRKFCEKHYSVAKNDLATVFLDRCLELCNEVGTTSVVLPQNWLFLTSYKKFREKLLTNETWHLIARLGPSAFETISGEVVKAVLIAMSRSNAGIGVGRLLDDAEDDKLIRGLDISEPRTAAEKASFLLTEEVKSVGQTKQLQNPDARIAIDELEGPLLDLHASAFQGMATGDYPCFGRKFWEFSQRPEEYRFQQSTVIETIHYGGREHVLHWGEEGDIYLERREGVRIQGGGAWNRKGIVASQMGSLPVTLYSGELFDNNSSAIGPLAGDKIAAVWCFCASPEYNEAVRRIDQKLNVTNATLVKVPFDLTHWSKVAETEYPNGLPKPYSDDPTQWIFHGHPCGSVVWDEENKWTAHGPLNLHQNALQIAVARLLGYHWPAELDTDMELADEQREWVNRCEALAQYADKDGIVCIPPVRGEAAASERLMDLLAAAYSDAWSNDTLAALLGSAGHTDKTLETWLRDKFFTQHCKLFQNRPFIWHIWDGLRDGFSALVNYHKLDRKLLETLIYTYLGDWSNRQRQDIAQGMDGAEERLAAAESLKKLEAILEGEAPYDIFVRWKPLQEQPIGWNPDINDGVRLNIRPFLTAPDVGKKGAGILRDKPNIKWTKDRGKDSESAPWFHLFKGDRINDHNLTLTEKLTATKKGSQ